MQRLTILSALALVLALGLQVASAGPTQAGERQYRSGYGSSGPSAHYYGDRHAHDGRYEKNRRYERGDERRHYGFVMKHEKPRYHAQSHRKWRNGYAAWQQRYWRGKPWRHNHGWNRGHRSFVYRY